MMYWTTGSIVSSMRFYKENLKSNPNNRIDAKYVIEPPYYLNHEITASYTTILSYHVVTDKGLCLVLGQGYLCPLDSPLSLMS